MSTDRPTEQDCTGHEEPTDPDELMLSVDGPLGETILGPDPRRLPDELALETGDSTQEE